MDAGFKIEDTISVVAEETEELCRCGFTAEHITEGGLECFSSEVTFRAKLHRTEQTIIEDLIRYLEQLVENGVTVLIQGLTLTVDYRMFVR